MMKPKRKRTQQRRWLMGLLALSIAGGAALCQIAPSDPKSSLIQFDVISELNMDWSWANTVVFTRYWVCTDYYAMGVVWSEPHGRGLLIMRTAVVVSDADGFLMANDLFPDWEPANKTYPRPLGPRGPFRWGGGLYELSEIRFAEEQALARRVHTSDVAALLEANQGRRTANLEVDSAPNGYPRELSRLKVQAADGRIEAMELFDAQDRSLARMAYEYESPGPTPRITRLTANLPARPEKLALRGKITATTVNGNAEERQTFKLETLDHVYHQGGRTCSVAYQDVRSVERRAV